MTGIERVSLDFRLSGLELHLSSSLTGHGSLKELVRAVFSGVGDSCICCGESDITLAGDSSYR